MSSEIPRKIESKLGLRSNLTGDAISNVNWIERFNSSVNNEAIEKMISMPMFKRLEFNITDLCNRKCGFCPRNDSKVYANKKEYFDIDLFSNVCSQLSNLNWNGGVVFSAFGEPLLHPNILNLINSFKSALPNSPIEIVTNGDRLKTVDSLKNLFEAGLDILKVSLYDGPDQLKKFESLRRSSRISPEQMILRPRYEFHDGRDLIMSNRAGTVNVGGDNGPVHRPCTFIFYKMVIDSDGSTLLCSHDWRKLVSGGNLNDKTLLECWSSGNFMLFRKDLLKGRREFSPCRDCDVDGTLNGMDEMQRWQNACS